ncbi:hypothetical protein SAMN06265375_1011152 [Muriicola jejuensis]|nr:hypothetical protein SAMN06265375_1011152 [Muriicola jejuensis]
MIQEVFFILLPLWSIRDIQDKTLFSLLLSNLFS